MMHAGKICLGMGGMTKKSFMSLQVLFLRYSYPKKFTFEGNHQHRKTTLFTLKLLFEEMFENVGKRRVSNFFFLTGALVEFSVIWKETIKLFLLLSGVENKKKMTGDRPKSQTTVFSKTFKSIFLCNKKKFGLSLPRSCFGA